LYPRQFSIIGSRMGTGEEFEKVLKFIEDEKLKPIIDKIFPLQRAADAQARMEKSEHIGKMVLEI